MTVLIIVPISIFFSLLILYYFFCLGELLILGEVGLGLWLATCGWFMSGCECAFFAVGRLGEGIRWLFCFEIVCVHNLTI